MPRSPRFLMHKLMALSNAIDRFSMFLNRYLRWLIVVTILISAGNAISRKFFLMSSNAFLEIQWYLFSAVFLLGAGYVFLKNEHVRVDVLSQHLSTTVRAWIDLVGILFFLFPFCIFLIIQSLPIVSGAWTSGEISFNAGGLTRWPVYALLPLGFLLLLVQALSEAIKRVAFLTGHRSEPTTRMCDPRAIENRIR